MNYFALQWYNLAVYFLSHDSFTDMSIFKIKILRPILVIREKLNRLLNTSYLVLPLCFWLGFPAKCMFRA